MKFYFVRHGKTQWNLEGRFQGANGDSPLLEEAILELELLGRHLSDIHFDAVFSSDLPRARHSAQLLMQENSQPTAITLTKNLREWNLGKLEGCKITTMTAIYPKQMDAFRHNLALFKPDIFEAETVYETTHRVQELVASCQNQGFENVLMVGHGANLTASIRSLLGYELGDLRRNGGLDNASLTILETKDFTHFTCLDWNDKSYL